MKNKSRIFIFVFLLLAIIYIVRGIAENSVTTEMIYRQTVEDSLNTKGIVVKYETLYKPESDGVFDARFDSGERISSGALMAVVYKGTVDMDIKNRLDQVNRKIAIIENNQSKVSMFSHDISKIEQEISTNIDGIIESSYSKDMTTVASLKYNISSLAERKAQASGNTEAKVSTLDTLKSKKAELEAQIGAAQSEIYSHKAGIFSTYIDGLEQLITPYNMGELTAVKIDELEELDDNNLKEHKEDEGGYVCKVIDNYRYFVAFKADEETASMLKPNQTAKIRFYDLSANASEVTVFSVSEPENGQAVVIVECDEYQKDLLQKRFVNLEFIRNTYSGFRVNIKALRTVDGVNGVYVIREKIYRFIPVNILYKMDDFVMVESQDPADELKIYDEVVVKASNLQEGKIVE